MRRGRAESKEEAGGRCFEKRKNVGETPTLLEYG
jgi:hypothetical protein